MAGDSNWTENQENIQDKNGAALFPSRASREMLRIGDTNRLIGGVRQGRLLDALNMHINLIFTKLGSEAGRKAFKPLADTNDYFQTLQLTMQGISREDFKQIEIAARNKKKGLFNRNKPASGVEESSDDAEGED